MRGARIQLRELRYFVRVAELKSFTHASEQLHVAQSAISRQIQKLEEDLGTQLFVRSGQGLELTDPGHLLLERARGILRQVSQAIEDVHEQSNLVSGSLTLGVPPAAGEILVPPVLTALGRDHPNLQLNIVESFSGNLYSKLVRQEINLALLHNPLPHKNVDIHSLLIEQMYLIGPASARGITLPATEVERLDGVALVLPGRPHSLRLLIEDTLKEQRYEFNLVREVDGLNVLRALVADGQGYTILTYGAVHRQVKQGMLSAKRLTFPPIHWQLALASLADQRNARAIQVVIRSIRAEVHNLVDAGIWRGDPTYPLAAAE